MAQLLDGTALAAAIRAEVAEGVARLRATHGIAVTLATVLGGDDLAARGYARSIARNAERAGIAHRQVALAPGADDAALRRIIGELNADRTVHGVLVLFPLPAPLERSTVALALDPRKDVDGLTPYNAGLLAFGQPELVPSTPLGGMELLRRAGIEVAGKEAVVVGRSPVVGKPMALLLLNANATVTVCHSRTPPSELAAICRRADILCAATGRAGLITAEMVKPGAVVVDFGMVPAAGGKLVGDVDFDGVARVAGWITPVPGGTGPMTTAMLLRNTLRAAELQTRDASAGKSLGDVPDEASTQERDSSA